MDTNNNSVYDSKLWESVYFKGKNIDGFNISLLLRLQPKKRRKESFIVNLSIAR